MRVGACAAADDAMAKTAKTAAASFLTNMFSFRFHRRSAGYGDEPEFFHLL
jgi:hypothetical protein